METGRNVPRRADDGKREDDLVDATAALLRLLIERGLVPSDEENVRRNVLRAVLEALDCGARLQPREGARTARELSARAGVIRQEVVGGVFAYLLLGELDASAEEACEACAADVADGHYEGIVLDLRMAAGPDLNRAHRCARGFLKSRLPTVVLIGPRTTGAGEVLAALLKEGGGVLLGRPTAGHPFGQEAKTLPGGEVVFVPVERPEKGWPRPVRPDVFVEGEANMPMLLRTDDDVDVNADVGLRRAVDLLRCIRVLGGAGDLQTPHLMKGIGEKAGDRGPAAQHPE